MTITFFGNTNNYPLLLCLAMQKLGVTTRLIVNRKDALHRPESKFPELAPGRVNWILDASDLTEDDVACESLRLGLILNFTYGSDAAILNDCGPALASMFGIPHLAFFTGSDLTYLANFSSSLQRQSDWSADFTTSPWGRLAERNWVRFVQKQRDGIKAARTVICPPRGLVPLSDDLLDEMRVPEEKRLFLPMADTMTLGLCPMPQAGPEGLRVFGGARVTSRAFGGVPTSQDDKGVEILVEGFAGFLRLGGQGHLRLVRKGQHVPETMSLISGLGIADRVTWLDELTLSQFYDEAAASDVVCDQLGTSFPGMVAADSMALGRPVIANWRPDLLGHLFGGDIPEGHAASAEAVTQTLLQLVDEPARRLVGAASRAFADRHLSPEVLAKKCLARLRA